MKKIFSKLCPIDASHGRLTNALLSMFLPLTLILVAGCEPTIKELCQKEFVQYADQLNEAKFLLAQASDSEKLNRKPASGRDPYSQQNIYWQDWSIDQLKKTQSFMDAIEEDRTFNEARVALSDVANNWVIFYGYAKDGDAKKLQETLSHIKTQISKAQQKVCLAIN